MARSWSGKQPSEVVERRWSVPLSDDDGISSVSAIGTGVTVDSAETDLNDAVVVLSGGSAGNASVAVTVVTRLGLTLAETFLLPVRAAGATYSNTVRDVCEFALRKVTGIGNDLDAAELEVAVEILNDMLALWRIDGLDVGIKGELASTDTLSLPESYLLPIKYNLAVLLAEEFGRELTQTLAATAVDSKRLLSNALFEVADLGFPQTISAPTDRVDELF